MLALAKLVLLIKQILDPIPILNYWDYTNCDLTVY